jgi:hypothetical protein
MSFVTSTTTGKAYVERKITFMNQFLYIQEIHVLQENSEPIVPLDCKSADQMVNACQLGTTETVHKVLIVSRISIAIWESVRTLKK